MDLVLRQGQICLQTQVESVGPLQPLELPWPAPHAHWTTGQRLEVKLFCRVLGPAQRTYSFT